MLKIFKKKEEKKSGCCTNRCDNQSMVEALEKRENGARIKVLGSGCAKCITLENNVKEALLALGKTEEIEHVTDFIEIASYGVMSTPALVIDSKVISFGKVLSKEEVMHLLSQESL